jgi:hypothetical protein
MAIDAAVRGINALAFSHQRFVRGDRGRRFLFFSCEMSDRQNNQPNPRREKREEKTNENAFEVCHESFFN